MKVKVINGSNINFVYIGPGLPEFRQTVHILLPPGAGPSKQEIDEHGGKDSTQGPVGDNGKGDPNAPLGTDANGKGANGYGENGSTSLDGKSSRDNPGPTYTDNGGNQYRVSKEFVTTILDCNKNVVRVIKWRMDKRGLVTVDK